MHDDWLIWFMIHGISVWKTGQMNCFNFSYGFFTFGLLFYGLFYGRFMLLYWFYCYFFGFLHFILFWLGSALTLFRTCTALFQFVFVYFNTFLGYFYGVYDWYRFTNTIDLHGFYFFDRFSIRSHGAFAANVVLASLGISPRVMFFSWLLLQQML